MHTVDSSYTLLCACVPLAHASRLTKIATDTWRPSTSVRERRTLAEPGAPACACCRPLSVLATHHTHLRSHKRTAVAATAATRFLHPPSIPLLTATLSPLCSSQLPVASFRLRQSAPASPCRLFMSPLVLGTPRPLMASASPPLPLLLLACSASLLTLACSACPSAARSHRFGS
jgi:hypothetical protein